MFPLFTPPSSGDDSDARQRLKIIAVIALGVLALAGFVMMFAMRSGVMTTPILFIVIGIAVLFAIIVPLIAFSNENQRKRDAAAKVKRGLDGTDMYTLIDRMVDDLDDDEATYLRRRLDDRERELERDSTKSALADLLNEREDSSREGWR